MDIKSYVYNGIIQEESRWFLKWITLRVNNKKLEFENGQLHSEINHLNHLLSVYKKDEDLRKTALLKQKKKVEKKKLKKIENRRINKKRKKQIKQLNYK